MPVKCLNKFAASEGRVVWRYSKQQRPLQSSKVTDLYLFISTCCDGEDQMQVTVTITSFWLPTVYDA